VIVAGLVGPPCLNRFQVRRRVKSARANGDPVRAQPRLPEKRGAALLAERISRIRHRVEPSQVAIIILDLQVSDTGGRGGHVMTGKAPATVAMAVKDVPDVSDDLEGDPSAKAPPRCPGCRVHVLAPPSSRVRPGAMRVTSTQARATCPLPSVVMVPPFLGALCPHQSDETAHRTVRLARRLTFRGVASSGLVRAGDGRRTAGACGRDLPGATRRNR
jgi:hypothetical protein